MALTFDPTNDLDIELHEINSLVPGRFQWRLTLVVDVGGNPCAIALRWMWQLTLWKNKI